MTTSKPTHKFMKNDDTDKMPITREDIISVLIAMAHSTPVTGETAVIAALLHGISGALLLDKDVELMDELTPFLIKLKKDAEIHLEAVYKKKSEKTSTPAPMEDDFFDKHQIIH